MLKKNEDYADFKSFYILGKNKKVMLLSNL